MNYSIMKLHKAMMVTACVPLAIWHNFLYSTFVDVQMLQFNSS
jgi:hypothetical protein